MFLGTTLDLSDVSTTAVLTLVSAQEYKAFAAFFSEHCKRRMTSRSNALGGSSGASLLEALHWDHPPLKQRVGEVSGFRTQHENLRGVLQTVLSDDDRSAVAEVMEMVVLSWAGVFFFMPRYGGPTQEEQDEYVQCGWGVTPNAASVGLSCTGGPVLQCAAACCALDSSLLAFF